MRNLKKVLSLALALVMLLGMMVVGAGATEFRDDSSIEYKEAADVLSELKVIVGRNDNFEPKTALTRAEGAAIIYRMLTGGAVANPVGGATGFVDVDSDPSFAWATGIIADLAGKGIISGVDATHFAPGEPLTGVAFGKMLLVALGYNPEYQGYVGGGWDGNVIRDCYSNGLSVSGVVMSNVITREQAAQMSLNTLEADMVYQKGGIQIGDVLLPGEKAEKIENDAKNDYAGRTNANTGDKYMQFCETYFPSLKKNTAADDDAFGNPQKVWRNGRETVGTYAQAETAVLSYENEKVTRGNLYSALGLTATKNVDVYVDGAVTEDVPLAKDNSTVVANLGSTVNVYETSADNYRVVVVNSYLGKVSSLISATSSRKAAINITSSTINGRFETTESFNVDDMVIFTKAGGAIKSAELAETATGTLNSFTSTKINVGGTSYNYSTNAAAADVPTAGSSLAGKDVKVFLDSFGNVLGVVSNDEATTTQYALLTKVGDLSLSKKGAVLILPDGTTAEVTLSSESYATDGVALVSYSVDSDGVYTLADAATQQDSASSATTIVETGKTTLAGLGSSYSAANRANNKTLFFVKTGSTPDKYSVYEGINAVPVLRITSANPIKVAAIHTSGMAEAVYVDVSDSDKASSSDTTSKKIFVLGNSSGRTTDAVKGAYYTYAAIVDGEYVERFETKVQVTAPTMFSTVGYDKNDVATTLDNVVPSKTSTNEGVNGSIDLGGDPYTYDDDTQVYFVEGNNLVSYSIGVIDTDANDKVWIVANNNDKLTLVVVQAVDADSPVTGDYEVPSGTTTIGSIASNANVQVPTGAKAVVKGNVSGDVTVTGTGEITVEGDVKAGAVIDASATTGDLTIEGTIEQGAQITIKNKSQLKLGENAVANEKVVLDAAGRSGDVHELPTDVAVVISEETAINYTNGTDTDVDTIYVGYTRAKTASEVTLTIKEGNTTVYVEKWTGLSYSAGRGSMRVSMSGVLSSATDANHTNPTNTLTGNQLKPNTYYTLTVVTNEGEGTTVSFTTPAEYNR